jgi:hypothetical protein
VTLADQTLTGLTQAGGTWSVTAATLPDGPHRVVMSVSDASGNRADFTQTLTVDTVPPVVKISGGAASVANTVRPTITGTSDAAAGSTVTVSIAGQKMTTLVQDNGTWNATPAVVGEGTWPVVATAADPAGNVGRARQTLTVDIDAPAGKGSPRLMMWLTAASYRATRGKHVGVSFILSAPAKVTLKVLRRNTVIATLSTSRRTAGLGRLTWNGKTKRKLVSVGVYKIIVRAISRAGASARVAGTVRIT